jgi:hypothetical protein
MTCVALPEILVTELIQWAINKKIHIYENLLEAYSCEPVEPTVSNTEFKHPTIQRANDYNENIAQTIEEFTQINHYAPTTVEEVIGRLKNIPPLGTTVDFKNDTVSINGSKPKKLDSLKRTIKRILAQLQKST